MKLFSMIAIVFMFSFQVSARARHSLGESGGTLCGSFVADCSQSFSNIWFDSSDRDIAVSYDYCQSVKGYQNQCMCVDTAVGERHGFYNGTAFVSPYRTLGSELRACGAGSSAQRKFDSDNDAYNKAKDWCSGKSNVMPPKSKALNSCRCVGGFFAC